MMESQEAIIKKNELKYDDLDGNISICLTTIIEKLKKGQMSAMIGAGFSKNANPAYPTWAELLVPAYCELKSICERNLTKDKRLKIEQKINKNPSKIAQDYIDMKGRREDLDIYLEQTLLKIDESRITNLDTHKSLLSINWNDIITTNWDTLLEKECSSEYIIVKKAKELKYQNKKRIIKINGSLRTREELEKGSYNFDDCFNYLYVITKDDFDTYHTEHYDFSNFMKVKMLQDSFCLIGFSGNDPNFKYWIKELKRTMTKGGNTEEPNPIFFIDTSLKIPDKATLQYYRNNYIIRISLDEAINYIENPINKIKIPILNIFCDCFFSKKTSEKFLLLFNFIILNTKPYFNHIQNEIPVILNHNNYNDILKSIAYKKINTSKDINLIKYNTLPIFYFNNLYFSDYMITNIRSVLPTIDSWAENEYLLIYNLCINNYYTLSNIYAQNAVVEIIENYNKKILPQNKTLSFLEQILKYYRYRDRTDELEKYFDEISTIDQCKNIFNYEKALKLYENLEYEQLQKFLDNWQPEKDQNPDALSILKKIRLLLAFDNIMFFSSKKDTIKELLDIAELSASKDANKQILLFIKYCRRSIFYAIDYLEPNDIINKEISELEAEGYKLPYEYVHELLPKSDNKNLKPNEDARYSGSSIKLVGREQAFSPIFRIFNFIEYTGIPAFLCLNEMQLLGFIRYNKDNEDCLYHILLLSIPFFGNSAKEDLLRTIIPPILRYMKIETLKILYCKIFSIIKYRIDNTINPTVYIYIITEIIKRLPKSVYTDYISYIMKKIEEKNKIVISGITKGTVWGWKKPFLEILKHINDFTDYKELMMWVMSEFLEDCKEAHRIKAYSYGQSEFFPYYYSLITDNKFIDEKKNFFKSENGKTLIAEDMKYTKKLALYAYDYMEAHIQKELISHFEENYTIKIDPYFIMKMRTPKIKEKCLELIKNYDVKAYNSLDHSLLGFVKSLIYSGLLTESDKRTICMSIMEKYTELQENTNYFKHDPYRRDISLKDEFFLIIAEILTKEQLEKDMELNNIYTTLEKTYKEQKLYLLSFEWVYTEDLQEFKQYFLETLLYFSYSHIDKECLDIINICLSKIIVQDSSEFEAVIEQFIKVYVNRYGKGVFENETTTGILIQILTKFKHKISFCYDDLFIKDQMQKLAKYMEELDIKHEVISYWTTDDIV